MWLCTKLCRVKYKLRCCTCKRKRQRAFSRSVSLRAACGEAIQESYKLRVTSYEWQIAMACEHEKKMSQLRACRTPFHMTETHINKRRECHKSFLDRRLHRFSRIVIFLKYYISTIYCLIKLRVSAKICVICGLKKLLRLSLTSQPKRRHVERSAAGA